MPYRNARPAPEGARTTHPGLIAMVAATALTALWAHHRARKAEREHPPVGNFVNVDGTNLHYVERGAGPPVVLLHGNGVPLQDFFASGLFQALASRHRVIAFDRPGFGFSARPRKKRWTPQAQAALIRQALSQLGVHRPVVVGHSWGAIVALAMAIGAPDAVAGIVLVSGYYYPTKRPDVWLNLPAAVPLLGDVLRYTALPVLWRLALKRAVRTMFAPMPPPEDFLQIVPRELILRPSQIRAASEDASFMVPAVARLSRFYSHLRLPVTLVAGRDDHVVRVRDQSERLHRDLPHSTLVVVEGSGHMVHHNETNAVASAVEAMSGGGLYVV